MITVLAYLLSGLVLFSFVPYYLNVIQVTHNLRESSLSFSSVSEDIVSILRTDDIATTLSGVIDRNPDLTPEDFTHILEPLHGQGTYFSQVYLLDEDRDRFEEFMTGKYNTSVSIYNFSTNEPITEQKSEYWATYLMYGTENIRSYDMLTNENYAHMIERTLESGEISYSLPQSSPVLDTNIFLITNPVFNTIYWGGASFVGRLVSFQNLLSFYTNTEKFISHGTNRFLEIHFSRDGQLYHAYTYGEQGKLNKETLHTVEALDSATDVVIVGSEIIHGVGTVVIVGIAVIGFCITILLAYLQYKRTILYRKAESASREKSRFVSNMSHEIRTPLNGIIGMSDVIDKQSLDKDTTYCVDVIRSCGTTLLNLVNNILDISAIESGVLNITEECVDLRSLLVEIMSDSWATMPTRYSSLIERSVVHISSSVPNDVVMTDPLRIRQVVNNLLTNAYKYTEKGAITIHVDCTTSTRKGHAVIKVEVNDTGIGMTPDNLKKLFSSFARFAQDKQIEGTGIGLSISKHIARALGGDLECVSSTPGVGSTFVFRFLIRGDVSRTGSVITKEFNKEYIKTFEDKKDQELKYQIKNGTRFLIVDDVRVNRSILERMLRKYDCDIDVAENGSVAVNMSKVKKYDVIIMDSIMPIMGGKEATATIRNGSQLSSKATILIVSADVLKESVEAYMESGADGFIPKPFTRKHIFSLLESTTSFVSVVESLEQRST